MRRGLFLALALLVALFGLTSRPAAVPLLVELKIRDPLTSNGPVPDDEASVASSENDKGKGSEKEKGNGKSDDGYSKAELKALTLWLSKDGKTWKALDGEITDLSDGSILARFTGSGGSGSGSTADLATSFGLPTSDITGTELDSYFIGVSTGTSAAPGPTLSAPLVSWSYATKNATTGSVPEPAAWTLAALGAAAMALAWKARRKA